MSIMTQIQANFIQNMKFFRRKAGLTQAQLAELCDVSNGNIGNIECGMTKSSFDLIEKISEALKVPAAELFKNNVQNLIQEEKFSNSQFEIIRETMESMNSEIEGLVTKTLKDLKYRIGR